MLGVTDKTAWFMMHRMREVMKDDRSPLGAPGKVVEIRPTDPTEQAIRLDELTKWIRRQAAVDNNPSAVASPPRD